MTMGRELLPPMRTIFESPLNSQEVNLDKALVIISDEGFAFTH